MLASFHLDLYSIIVTSALMIWKGLMCITGTKSPVVVVLTGSMEPGFGRGDILLLQMSKDPIRVGEIVVYHINGRDIPIVHRVIKVHEKREKEEVDILTKGDNNLRDDISLYNGELWLKRHHIVGRAVGVLPYVGYVTIILTDKPIIKVSKCQLHSFFHIIGTVFISRRTILCKFHSSIQWIN
ncbi:uncharacterized protein [Primulina huaijiensis]|uniref:uncharacterized protein isoform X2 n=1 Tax=Primulina huaijiensis TaxID=1492673 RepID=UPI003CC710D5